MNVLFMLRVYWFIHASTSFTKVSWILRIFIVILIDCNKMYIQLNAAIHDKLKILLTTAKTQRGTEKFVWLKFTMLAVFFVQNISNRRVFDPLSLFLIFSSRHLSNCYFSMN